MKVLKQTLLALSLSTVIISCSSDDPATLDVSDSSISVDENQAIDAVLGSISATGTDGTFTYSITNQLPTGAIAIDAVTGQIKVADASIFDFETNPTITATVDVMGNSITETAQVTITLNDKDDIEFLLSTSKAAYTAASDGDWVVITETEYNDLANNLNEITKAGTTDTEYNSEVVQNAVGPWSRANYTTTATIPANGYTIAFKYIMASGTDVTGFKVKQSSTSNTDGFSDIGNALPSHSGTSQDVFFALKGNDTSVTAAGYLGIFQPQVSGYSIQLIGASNNNGAYYGAGDVSSIGEGQWDNYLAAYQGLCTTQKQW